MEILMISGCIECLGAWYIQRDVLKLCASSLLFEVRLVVTQASKKKCALKLSSSP